MYMYMHIGCKFMYKLHACVYTCTLYMYNVICTCMNIETHGFLPPLLGTHELPKFFLA